MGKEDAEIVRLAGQHVYELFRKANGDPSLVYHGFKRSRELVRDSKEIAKGSKLNGADGQVLLLSAWFHDAGYAAGNGGSREKSIEIAREFLARQGQPDNLVDAVADCLKAEADGEPRESPARDVLHDALLAPVAGKSYVEEAELLRLEEERRTGTRYSDVEWTQSRIEYLQQHPYRTRWAQIEYDRGRAKNLVRLHKLLRKQREESTSHEAKGQGKMVENVFSDLTRNQLRLLAIADRRTSTMIHVNAIMISLVVALILRKLEEHNALLAPTVLLLCVNLAVVVLSILSMRVSRNKLRRYPREELAAHEANPMLVTNEVNFSLHEYLERMKDLTADAPALQKAMIEYVYFMRKLLMRRRRDLQLTYNIFIYGLAASLAFFTIAIIRQ